MAREVRVRAADVARAVGGRLLHGAPDRAIEGFSIDTRTLQPGDLYIAIRGERLDGHAFVADALKAGACGALVSAPPTLPPAAMEGRILVAAADTTRALQSLARWVRRTSGARVVAITGSAGKTTTKEIAAAFLAERYDVMRSSGNLNNHIGLPLSLLELRRGAEVAVVELGMNHAGEISRLVAIAEPEVRVWTNVAEVHIEFFGSIEAIADAKAEILEGAVAGSVLVANADDRLVMARAAAFEGRTVTYSASTRSSAGGSETAPAAAPVVVASDIEDLGLGGMRATVRTPTGVAEWRVPLLGRGNLMNSLAALAVGLEFDVPLDVMAARAATLVPAAHRGQVTRLPGGITIVDDAYNSNPRALEGALAVLATETRHTRRIAVLGEMLELGGQSVALHEACGRAAARSGLAGLVTVGGEPARAMARAAVEAGMPAQAVVHVANSDEAAECAVNGVVQAGDVVLVKGSRGIRTERVVQRLCEAFGGAA